jgi:hypothetical protein
LQRGKKAAAEVREPLPELQPFYGVLTWPNFHGAKHVRTHLSKMRKRLLAEEEEESGEMAEMEEREGADVGGDRAKRMWVEDSPNRRECWQRLQDYHSSPARAEHGSNWLTERYFEMMVAASDDPSNNCK